MNKFRCVFWILVLGYCSGNAQVFTYEQFLKQVYTEHPVAKQIGLLQDKAAQQLQYAKGGFDPKLGTNWDGKHFKDKTYYNIFNAHLKVPTWIGVEVEAGYNYTNGYYLNPENTLPQAGQAYLGVNIPLLKGMWTNERKTAVQQAKVLQQATTVEIQAALNDLLYQAAKSYWEWTKLYNSLLMVKQALEVANEQLIMVRTAYLQGDKPAIDTLKSFMQVQEREILLRAAQLDVENAARTVSVYLWEENGQPMELAEKAEPVVLQQLNTKSFDQELLENSLAQLNQHPKLQKYVFKLQDLELERKLKANKLLPKLDLKYNFLSTKHVAFFDGTAAAPIENYKLGVKFSMPILLRKERADLKMNALKQRETNYLQDAAAQELKIKIENYFNTVQTNVAQVEQLEKMIQNYVLLLEAEQTKLRLGESSVFMVNTRENQLLEARLKLIKQQTEYLKARAAFFWITAKLSTNFD